LGRILQFLVTLAAESAKRVFKSVQFEKVFNIPVELKGGKMLIQNFYGKCRLK
jgi:hypothetical protein